MGGRGSSSPTSRAVSITAQVVANNGVGMKLAQSGHYDDRQMFDGGAYSYPSAVNFTAELLGVDREDALKYNEAVYEWTDGSYADIREVQRGLGGNAVVTERAALLEEYIAKAPKWGGGMTYRGVESKMLPQVGDVIDMRGSSSWSSSLGEAQYFSYVDANGNNAGKFPIIFQSKTQRHGTSVKHLAEYSSEDEVVVSKNAKYRVTGVSKSIDGRYYIDLKELN